MTQTLYQKPPIFHPQSLHLSPEAKKQRLWRRRPGLFMPTAHMRGGERSPSLQGKTQVGSLASVGWGPMTGPGISPHSFGIAHKVQQDLIPVS